MLLVSLPFVPVTNPYSFPNSKFCFKNVYKHYMLLTTRRYTAAWHNKALKCDPVDVPWLPDYLKYACSCFLCIQRKILGCNSACSMNVRALIVYLTSFLWNSDTYMCGIPVFCMLADTNLHFLLGINSFFISCNKPITNQLLFSVNFYQGFLVINQDCRITSSLR